jgi:HPt (histidine-containing phosphotransfer) domain-containing protein
MSSVPGDDKPISPETLDRVLAEIDEQVPPGVLDCRATLERLDGDIELFHDLLGFYFRDAPTLLDEVGRAIAAEDAVAVRHWAHRLKGLICNFDARLAVQSAAELEKLGLNRQLPLASEVFRRLQAELEDLTTQLRRF